MVLDLYFIKYLVADHQVLSLHTSTIFLKDSRGGCFNPYSRIGELSYLMC